MSILYLFNENPLNCRKITHNTLVVPLEKKTIPPLNKKCTPNNLDKPGTTSHFRAMPKFSNFCVCVCSHMLEVWNGHGVTHHIPLSTPLSERHCNCTVQCAHYTVYSVICTVQCTHYTMYSVFCTVQCTHYTMQSVICTVEYTLHCVLFNLYSTVYTLYYVLCNLYSTLYRLQHVLCNLFSTLYRLQSTQGNVYSTVYTLHCVLFNVYSSVYTLHYVLCTLYSTVCSTLNQIVYYGGAVAPN